MPDRAPRRAALYARVSTDHQELENQLSQLRAEAERAGYTVVAEWTDTESGGKPGRYGLELARQAARRRRYDVLLFWSLDRLSREGVPATVAYLAELHQAGVTWRSLQQPELDTTGPYGWVIVALLASLAEMERQLIRTRTRAGLERARKEGKRLGRPPALYDRRRAVELRQAGHSVRQIAAALNVSPATISRLLSRAPS